MAKTLKCLQCNRTASSGEDLRCPRCDVNAALASGQDVMPSCSRVIVELLRKPEKVTE